MDNDNGKEEFSNEMQRCRIEYRSVMSLVREQYDEIEKSLKSNVPLDVITEKLNKHYKINTNKKTLKQCLYRLRKARKPVRGAQIYQKSAPQQSLPSTTATINQHSELSTAQHHHNEEDWNEVEKIVGYRLPDNIRNHVAIKDNKVIPKFRKGTILTAEIRDELATLRRILARGVPTSN